MKLVKSVKHGLCIFTSIVVMGTLTGCGSQAGSMDEGKLVKIVAYVSGQTPTSMVIGEAFRPRLERLTDRRYDIRICDSEVLGNEKVTYDCTGSGIIEMYAVETPMWSEALVMTIPDFSFVFRDVEHARRCCQGQLGSYIVEELEVGQPVTLMSWSPDGVRTFSLNKKLIELGDFEGQKLGIPNNPIHVKLAKSLGVNVVIMDMGEVPTALEQGVADGQNNSLSVVKNKGWYEVQDYIYDTDRIVASLELLAGDQFWGNTDEADKEIFRQIAGGASDYVQDLYTDQLIGDKQFMKGNGLTVIDLSGGYREAMRIKIQPIYGYLDEKYEWAGATRKTIKEVK